MNRKQLTSGLLATAAAALASCSSTPKTAPTSPATEKLKSMSDKLAAAKSLRFTATRESSPGFSVGLKVAEHATINGAVVRPNQVAIASTSSLGRRTVKYDGKNVTVIDHTAGTHATVPAPATSDATLMKIEEVYGFLPPLSELLVNDPAGFLLSGVDSSEVVGTEKIAGAACDHLRFHQERLTIDVWIDAATQLPKRLGVTYPNGQGGAPLTSTATITSLQLGAAVSASEFTAAPPASSRLIEMIPLQD